MSTGISSSDFVGQWSLSFADIDFINSKPAATRLGLAAQLKFFGARGFFADDKATFRVQAAKARRIFVVALPSTVAPGSLTAYIRLSRLR